ncbi:RDD family protein [Paenibacillus elgii]
MYSGFWKRLCAYIIDGIILYVGSVILGIIFTMFEYLLMIPFAMNSTESVDSVAWVILGVRSLLFLVTGWLYFAIMESSKWRATLGKLAVGSVVVDERNERISFARASGRYWSKLISVCTLYVGFFMAGFTGKKQALHDIIAKTYVVDKKVFELLTNGTANANVQQQ